MKVTKRVLTLSTVFLLVLAMLTPMLSLTACGNEASSLAELFKSNNGCTVSGSYLLGVKEKTAQNGILSSFYQGNISIVNDGTYVGTGSKIRLTDGNETIDELTVVVLGDASGDGQVSAVDYLFIKRAFLGTYNLTGEYLLASCLSDTEQPTSKDYIKVKRHFLGTYNIYDDNKQDYNGTKIAYIPLDDRPVNVDRAKYLAQSAGFELMMPESDYYSTKLDGTGTNTNGTKYGNREELVKWLKQVDAECDYFVISLDQMLSGGLVNSRVQKNTDLSYEKEIIDYLIELNKNNTVYFFDTVMRLASTVHYNGYGLEEYKILRSYGAVGRKVLSGSDLTTEKIIAGYKYDTNGEEIYCSLPESEIDDYLAARARKLKLANYLLSNGKENLNYCFIGVDDSSPNNTIQTNEIAYLENKLDGNGAIFAGCDELGLMGIAKLTSEIYKCNLNVAVSYFGGSENYAADSFDIGTLKSNVETHLNTLNASIVPASNASLEVLVLTRPNGLSLTKYSNDLLDRLEANIQNLIPTVVIDASSKWGTLQTLMIQRKIPLSTLVGYSNWNTVGNAIGIAVSQGITRTVYLKNSAQVTDEANIGFIKSMTFAYIKDISYKINCASKFTLLSLINNSEIITGMNNYTTAKIGTVSVGSYQYPWHRNFEATFDIFIK